MVHFLDMVIPFLYVGFIFFVKLITAKWLICLSLPKICLLKILKNEYSQSIEK